MSPEQALGTNHVDGRSDVYSLGCVIYEMLVGQPPFDGPNAMAILARHSMEEVPSLRVVRHSVPGRGRGSHQSGSGEDAGRPLSDGSGVLRCSVAGGSRPDRTADLTAGITGARGEVLQSSRRRSRPRVPRLWAIAAAVLVALTGTGWGIWRFSHRPVAPASATGSGGLDPHRIAVLYFQAEGGKDSLGYLADGLTEGLIRQLDQVPGLDVISKGGVAAYRGDSVSRDSVARALRAGTLVAGGIEREGGQLRVTVRLVDGSSGAEFGRASFAEPAGQLLAVQDSVSQQVAGLIRERLGEEIRLREQRNRTRSVAAWALVQRAEQARKQAEALVEKNDTTGASAGTFERADSLYAQAHLADPSWTEPLTDRAGVAYRRSRLVGLNGVAAKPWIEKGLKLADSALALAPEDPDGLEVRGTLRYWKWLLRIEADPQAVDQLLNGAQNDLETAVRVNPSQAGAWAILSHMYSNTKSETDAKLAGLRAYEADAYLRDAPQVLNRLFTTSYDLTQFADAARWCDEGARRFPSDFNFTGCKLWIMTTRIRDPDVALAWKLADSLRKLPPRAGGNTTPGTRGWPSPWCLPGPG